MGLKIQLRRRTEEDEKYFKAKYSRYKSNLLRLAQARTYATRKQAMSKKKKPKSNDYNRSSQVYNVRGGFW